VQTLYLQESEERVLELDARDADELRSLGRRLASKKGWWGEEAGASERPERTVIRCDQLQGREWRLRIVDAIGLIAVGGLRICVQPKIPATHLRYLMALAMRLSRKLPRVDDQPLHAAAGASWWDLAAAWFLREMQIVVRRDLIRDYRAERAPLAVVHGRVHALQTVRSAYQGRVAIDCEYEEFDQDNALNRVLKAAAMRIARSAPTLWRATEAEEVRRLRLLGLRILAHMDEVGDIRPGDLRVQPDLRTSYCADALALARHILQGIEIEFGRSQSQAFLIRTPEIVEAGILTLLQERLPEWDVRKHGRSISGSSMTLNPDLIFGSDVAIADVYQVTAFAAGYRTANGAVITFKSPERAFAPELVQLGDIHLRRIAWNADDEVSAAEAADALVSEVQDWLIPIRTAVLDAQAHHLAST
jgi:hypothetical protein